MTYPYDALYLQKLVFTSSPGAFVDSEPDVELSAQKQELRADARSFQHSQNQERIKSIRRSYVSERGGRVRLTLLLFDACTERLRLKTSDYIFKPLFNGHWHYGEVLLKSENPEKHRNCPQKPMCHRSVLFKELICITKHAWRKTRRFSISNESTFCIPFLLVNNDNKEQSAITSENVRSSISSLKKY